MYVDNPVPVLNIPPVRFICGTTSQLITVGIKGYWDPEISVAVITMVVVPEEEALVNIGMNSEKVVIDMECGVKVYWVRFLGEVCPTQILYQCVYWLTSPPSVEEVSNIDCPVAVFLSAKKKCGSKDPDIKSWGQPVNSLKDILGKRCNLKGSLMFFSTVFNME